MIIFDKSGPVGGTQYAAGGNQAVIAAPGAGLSLYLQTATFTNLAAGAVTTLSLHPAGGNPIAFATLPVGQAPYMVNYPGGFKLPVNTALQVDVAGGGGNILIVTVTYIIGPS